MAGVISPNIAVHDGSVADNSKKQLPINEDLVLILAKALLDGIPFASLIIDLYSYKASMVEEEKQKEYLASICKKIEQLAAENEINKTKLESFLKNDNRYRSLAHFSMMRIAEEGADTNYIRLLRNATLNIPLMDVQELIRQDIDHALRTMRPIHLWTLQHIPDFEAVWDADQKAGSQRQYATYAHGFSSYLKSKKDNYPYFDKIIADLQSNGTVYSTTELNNYSGDFLQPVKISTFGSHVLKALSDPVNNISPSQLELIIATRAYNAAK